MNSTGTTIEQQWQSLKLDPLVSIREIEAVTGCDPATIRRWITMKKLIGVRIGGRGQWRCRRSQVLRLLKKMESDG